jgi:hypothetical protein
MSTIKRRHIIATADEAYGNVQKFSIDSHKFKKNLSVLTDSLVSSFLSVFLRSSFFFGLPFLCAHDARGL